MSKELFPSESVEVFDVLQRAKAGDAEAKEHLWNFSQKYLLLIANQDLDADMLQKFGASDVVQQSLWVADRKIEAFEGSSKGEFLAWMRQILVNECRQAVRSFRQTEKRDVKREQKCSSPNRDSLPLQINDRHLTPSTEAVKNEQLELVNRAMTKLAKTDQQVIKMRNWQELSFEAIGQALNKSPEAARKIWSRAILKLETELKKINAN